MKKRLFILFVLCTNMLLADIILTQEQEKNWQIELSKAKETSFVPVATSMMRVTTPPKLLQTISLPYEAKVIRLSKANFESVTKGELLAVLSSSKWIEAQKDAIDAYIEFSHNQNEANRKSKLCQEQIIAEKECIAADAELQRVKVKLSSAKNLLKSYGATDEAIQKLTRDSTIVPNIELYSPANGVIVQTNMELGKNISASDTLFMIKTAGEDWLEGEITHTIANTLKPAQEIIVKIDNKEIKSKILLISPTINPQNQSRYIRIFLPKDAKLIDGFIAKAELNIIKKALVITKKALSQSDTQNIVFVKKEQAYKPIKVSVLAEDKNLCYLEYSDELRGDIATSQISVLLNKMQESQHE
ncbi:MAG: efflux RND transporter periplasmic adaptor subunit [Sulfurimonas sp.]|uniref:efflux RND transporter periplasmic adaptor subunit n=1 Tax=Sulfurimonas sp. TaxID=2022749 RepID=UPI0026066A74|nr:efflux RND transporter periplasmic adaptor subunit [Sulfurimonas sp.]MDD2652205.1 efflux RND transporter periplasmic adaptor subunit [Sulfurimonas sp.]MDD3450513.1 efflux RND transporter periplasmic adaptor subunit [Sulfurimonas sp.]